jgi:DNA-binding response OmpR family regulator
MKVLVVDDEEPIVEAVAYNLRCDGYEPLTAADAEQCMTLFRKEKPALVILDVMLPTASGFDVCRMLRRESNTPIILLTARADEADRVVGLELGADDYVTKPFSTRELMARVKSVLRRTTSTGDRPGDAVITSGALTIDTERHEVTVDGRAVDLTRKEFELLTFMAAHPGQVFTRQVLLDRVWGADAYVVERTVDVHIRWLREKIETTPSAPERIVTVRGVGYKLVSA